MTVIEEIRNTFSILHDGTISAWTGDKNAMVLTVECQYLAELIDQSYEKFYIELREVDDLFFSTWPNSSELPVQILTEPSDIFRAGLVLLSADIKDRKVVVACSQHDIRYDYCGGNLTINCQSINVFDQNKNELTIDEFGEICKNYWDEFGKE